MIIICSSNFLEQAKHVAKWKRKLLESFGKKDRKRAWEGGEQGHKADYRNKRLIGSYWVQ